MTKIRILAPLGAAALLLATTAASAQSARFSDVDRDGNGLLSFGELVESFGSDSANRIWSSGGGRDLSRTDIRRMNASRDDDDDDGFDDDDDDRGFGDDDDDDRGFNDDDDDGSDDDDDDGGSSNDDDDDGGSDDDD